MSQIEESGGYGDLQNERHVAELHMARSLAVESMLELFAQTNQGIHDNLFRVAEVRDLEGSGHALHHDPLDSADGNHSLRSCNHGRSRRGRLWLRLRGNRSRS
jgi:hypothetical protein